MEEEIVQEEIVEEEIVKEGGREIVEEIMR